MDYKRKYEETKVELDNLKRIIGSRKENLVEEIYKVLGITEDNYKGQMTYGYFFWKLSIEELIFLIDYIKKKNAKSVGDEE